MLPQAVVSAASVTLLLASAISAFGAEIILEKSEFVGAGLTFHLHIEGRITPGDAAQVHHLTENLPEGREAFLVVSLNSPGGDVYEGLDIARDLQAKNMQVVTDVMTRDGKPANCASACSYVYLGGSYRFLHDGSELGVHQFRYVGDRLSLESETTREVQELSAQITGLISDAHVDAGFFTLMGQTPPENINSVDRETLERYNVVNQERAYQKNEFTLTKGEVNLVMTHVGLYGTNRLSSHCADGKVVFNSEILVPDTLHDPAELSRPGGIPEVFSFVVMADRYKASADIIDPQIFEYPTIRTKFTLTDDRLATLLSAKRMDVRLTQKSGIFVGASFDIDDGKLRNLVESCAELAPLPPSSLGGTPDLEEPLSPVFVAATLGAVQRGVPSIGTPELQISEADIAVGLYNTYLEAWSRPNDEALAYMDGHYSTVINFYDKEISKSELMAEKRAFAERWPVREYSAHQDTFEISCTGGACLVAALIDWKAHSPSRGQTSTGVAWYGLGFDMTTGQVLFENGESRRR